MPQVDLPRMPAVFIGHGSPMNTLQSNRYTEAWRQFGRALPTPQAILVISAHWYVRGVMVTAMEWPRTIHDFGGFPQALFDVQYPAPGSPALANRVRQLLQPSPVGLDQNWGLDHGAWSVLAHLFPDAKVPVVQLSIDVTQPPQFHYELAQKLKPLRDEGVLIVGSGNVVHNLPLVRGGEQAPPYDWAERFNSDVRAHLLKCEHAPLVSYEAVAQGPDHSAESETVRLSIPTPEHYLPLLYVIGLQESDDAVSILVDGIELGSISMLSIAVGVVL
jgi:4,5-DOPA dioxygenase extradiol